MRRSVGRNVSVGSHEYERQGHSRFEAPVPTASVQAQAESRALIARFFIDLRQALRLTVPQAAHYLAVRPEVVEALETGQVEYLPQWQETSAIIMTYTSMAGVNGRPVLNAIGTLFTQLSVRAAPTANQLPAPTPDGHFREPTSHFQQQPFFQQPAAQPQAYAAHQQPYDHGRHEPYEPPQGYSPLQGSMPQQSSIPQQGSMPQNLGGFPPRPRPQQPVHISDQEPDIARSGLAVSSRNLLRAGSVIASGARRLPQEALYRVRERPQRAVYALSLPLGLLLLMMHSSIFATISAPFSVAVQWVSGYMQEHYGPIRDGMRYIEVDDPETRRADKLQIGSGS